MGKGNPQFRTYEGELVPTYFIDISTSLDEAKKFILEDNPSEYKSIDEISDSIAYKFIEHEEDINWQTFDENTPDLLDMNPVRDHDGQVNCSYRNEAYILCEGEYSKFLIEGENYHLGIGFIPNFKLDDLWDDIYSEEQEKEDWYVARNLDFSKRIDKLAAARYRKLSKLFQKEANEAMSKLHQCYDINKRNGAWMSFQLPKSITKHLQYKYY